MTPQEFDALKPGDLINDWRTGLDMQIISKNHGFVLGCKDPRDNSWIAIMAERADPFPRTTNNNWSSSQPAPQNVTCYDAGSYDEPKHDPRAREYSPELWP